MSYQDQSSLSEPLIPPNSASTPTSTPDDLANLRSSLTAFESLVQSIEEGLTGLENHGLTTQNWGSGNKNDRRGSMRETRGRIGGLIEVRRGADGEKDQMSGVQLSDSKIPHKAPTYPLN